MKVVLRDLTLADYTDLKESIIEAYSGSRMSHWREENIARLLETFPEGQVCIEINNKVLP